MKRARSAAPLSPDELRAFLDLWRHGMTANTMSLIRPARITTQAKIAAPAKPRRRGTPDQHPSMTGCAAPASH